MKIKLFISEIKQLIMKIKLGKLSLSAFIFREAKQKQAFYEYYPVSKSVQT